MRDSAESEGVRAPSASSRTQPEGWGVAVAASAGVTGIAGAMAGLVWGGVGGRLAMRVLFLTSDDGVRGAESDSGFEIGRFTLSGTMFLLVFTMVSGAVIGLVGGVLRMVTTGTLKQVALGAGVTSAALFGTFLVAPEGVDLQILDPVWLAVALFVVLPGVWATLVVFLADWLTRPGVLFFSLPARIDERRFGYAGWVVMALFTILGLAGLIADIRDLA